MTNSMRTSKQPRSLQSSDSRGPEAHGAPARSGPRRLLVVGLCLLSAALLLLALAVARSRLTVAGDPVADVSGTPPVPETPAIVLHHADYRRVSEWDPGSARVFLRLAGDVRIAEILLDDLPIPVWGLADKPGDAVADADDPHDHAENAHFKPDHDDHDDQGAAPAGEAPSAFGHGGGADLTSVAEDIRLRFGHKRILWARLRPGPEAPDGLLEFVAKFSRAPARPFKLVFHGTRDTALEVVVRPRPNRLAIAAATFSDDLRKAYLFVENRGDQSLTIDSLALDGARRPGVAAPGDHPPGAWAFHATSLAVAPGATEVVAIIPLQPFRRGAFHTVRIATAEGAATAERLRVVAGFALAVDDQDAPAGYSGLDAARSPYHDKLPEAVSPDGIRDLRVFNCAMHTYRADHTRSAREIFSRYDRMLDAHPELPTSLHLCRVRPEEGYGKFGETTDILRVNPFITSAASKPADGGDDPVDLAAHNLKSARQGAAPRPVFSVLATHRANASRLPAAPDDLRRLAYAILGEAPKGIFYRHHGWGDAKFEELNAEIRRLNAELGRLRPWLSTAHPVPWAETAAARLRVGLLLAPERGVVLLLRRAGAATGADSPAAVDIRLDLPPWLVPRAVKAATSDGFVEPPGPVVMSPTVGHAAGHAWTLTVPNPNTAQAYVIECEWRTQ